MHISNYILTAQLGDDNILIYHTLYTTLIQLPEDIYKQIFVNLDFTNKELVEELCKMGFIQEDSQKELDIIQKIRAHDANSTAQSVTIFSTNDCNARCYYCFEEGIERNKMSPDTAEQIIRFIINNFHDNKLHIQWFGGEPLMAMDIIEYITLKLKDAGYILTTHITTNGSYICPEIIDFFKANYESVSFQVTIDDIGERYARIKRYIDIDSEVAFDKIISNCKLIISNQLFLAIRINFLPKKFNNAKDIYMKLKMLFGGMDTSMLRIYLSPITLSEECNACSETYLDAPTFVELAKFHYYNHVNDFSALERKSILMQSFYLKPKPSSCGATRKNQLVITADGKLYKCHRFVRYGGNKYVVGNVWDGIDKSSAHYISFMDIELKDEECIGCKSLPICQGGCYAITHIYGKKLACAKAERMETFLKLYYDELKLKTENDIYTNNNPTE